MPILAGFSWFDRISFLVIAALERLMSMGNLTPLALATLSVYLYLVFSRGGRR